jgi:hypothetical protein
LTGHFVWHGQDILLKEGVQKIDVN